MLKDFEGTGSGVFEVKSLYLPGRTEGKDESS
jgi:hypothetical protein